MTELKTTTSSGGHVRARLPDGTYISITREEDGAVCIVVSNTAGRYMSVKFLQGELLEYIGFSNTGEFETIQEEGGDLGEVLSNNVWPLDLRSIVEDMLE